MTRPYLNGMGKTICTSSHLPPVDDKGGGETAMFRVEIVRTECTGCELCTQTCPDYFEMAGDALSTLKGGKRVGENDELELQDAGCTKEAAADCPVNCIHVYENDKKLI
jgi:ferredoxin